mmetsp:Transcript_102354/g.220962  ORF Transcript_102354/g.220962 Transcript_102354/m.220962 type:complete len:164 (+) Transcript_102354:677-1168(+)
MSDDIVNDYSFKKMSTEKPSTTGDEKIKKKIMKRMSMIIEENVPLTKMTQITRKNILYDNVQYYSDDDREVKQSVSSDMSEINLEEFTHFTKIKRRMSVTEDFKFEDDLDSSASEVDSLKERKKEGKQLTRMVLKQPLMIEELFHDQLAANKLFNTMDQTYKG